MKGFSNNTIAISMIALMVFSLISTIFISYSAERRIITTGKATSQGEVSLVVYTSTPTPGPGGSSGGGGGGGASQLPITHILDFRTKDIYSFSPGKKDNVIAIFLEGKNYTFNILDVSSEQITLELSKTNFIVNTIEITSLDLDRDGTTDLTIEYNGKDLIFTSFRRPVTGEEIEPIISKQKIVKETGLEIPEIYKGKSYLIALMVIIILILLVIIYQNLRLKGIERLQKGKIIHIRKEDLKKSKTEKDKRDLKNKIGKQLNALEKAYKSSYVTKESYNKGKNRLKNLLRKL